MKSKFNDVIGISPESKILNYFLHWGDEFDINISDVVNAAKVGRARALEVVGRFVDIGILTQTRKIGSSRLYKLNTNSEIVKKASKLMNTILVESMKRDLLAAS